MRWAMFATVSGAVGRCMKSICLCYMLERLGDMTIRMSASWAELGWALVLSLVRRRLEVYG